MKTQSFLHLILAALLQLSACTGPTPKPPASELPTSKPTSEIDLYSQKVQAGLKSGEIGALSISFKLPDGRKRTITANGWTDS